MPWTFFPFTMRRFDEFLWLFLFGVALRFRFSFACPPPFLLLLQYSFFFLSIFFFLDIPSISEGIWSGQQLSFLLFLLILLKPSSLPALFQRQLLVLDQHSCYILCTPLKKEKSRKRKESRCCPDQIRHRNRTLVYEKENGKKEERVLKKKKKRRRTRERKTEPQSSTKEA